jgi:hypothetical protein
MPNKQPLLNKKPTPGLIRLYLDFDGTLTGLKGSLCVYSTFYKRLQTDTQHRYDECVFLDEESMISQIQAGFQLPENEKMQVAKEALAFLNKLLDLGAEINIVSLNRQEYIRAVLLAHGMDKQHVEKIIIKDINSLGYRGKYGVVLDMEQAACTKAKVTIVCDDNPSDYHAMIKAVKESGNGTQLISRCNKPGEFDWAEIDAEASRKNNLQPGFFSSPANDDSAASSQLTQEDAVEVQLENRIKLKCCPLL